jgi:hypothetical protein
MTIKQPNLWGFFIVIKILMIKTRQLSAFFFVLLLLFFFPCGRAIIIISRTYSFFVCTRYVRTTTIMKQQFKTDFEVTLMRVDSSKKKDDFFM